MNEGEQGDSSDPTTIDDETFEAYMKLGLSVCQHHYGKQRVSIADAVNYFHSCNDKVSALPVLILIAALFHKYADGFEECIRGPQSTGSDDAQQRIMDVWIRNLKERYDSLP